MNCRRVGTLCCVIARKMLRRGRRSVENVMKPNVKAPRADVLVDWLALYLVGHSLFSIGMIEYLGMYFCSGGDGEFVIEITYNI